ncbi:hypothetical protein FRC10_002973 [Ceratobasidium sp. 414]|nr:hypothetical protein FRC10_002973 [Ceratobasidium sp. 414]
MYSPPTVALALVPLLRQALNENPIPSPNPTTSVRPLNTPSRGSLVTVEQGLLRPTVQGLRNTRGRARGTLHPALLSPTNPARPTLLSLVLLPPHLRLLNLPSNTRWTAYWSARWRARYFALKFVDNSLTADSTKLQTVLDDCKDDLDGFRFQDRVTRERQLYNPIREVLNIIKRAVDGVPGLDNLPAFVGVSAEPIPSHYDDTTGVKPDLALFDGPTRHWETVRMPIEVKRQATYLKTGMKQLARYARAVFAHQLHRRHLYGLATCKWDATFVRFDRSGILYSKPIDMRGEEPRKAFAGLMMLDEEAVGYDTAFTTRARRNGRLEYYVDLPAHAFPAEEASSLATDAKTGADTNPSTGIAGPGDLPGAPPKLPIRRLRCDVFKACNCGGTMDDSCEGCLDRTPNRDRVLVAKNLTDLDIEIPEEKEGEEETQKQDFRIDDFGVDSVDEWDECVGG